MNQVCKKINKKEYSHEPYAEYSTLPPNLPLPTQQSTPAFIISFHNLLYLDQLKSSHQDIQLRLLWWGRQTPHILKFIDNNHQLSPKVKYIICTPVQHFISYLNDMKFLAIEVVVRKVLIGCAYLNFNLLKGWVGQREQGNLDIKRGSKKIGEISYTIQITKAMNPCMPNTVDNKVNSLTSDMRQVRDERGNPNRIQNNNSKKVNLNKIENMNSSNINSHSNSSNHRTINRQNDHVREEQPQYYRPAYNHNNPPPQPNINKDNHHPTIQYEKELIRLIQDYNILFHTTNQQQHPTNIVQIHILKVQIDTQQMLDNIEVIVPLIDAKQNVYCLSKGGIIKIEFSNDIQEGAFINYLKECTMVIRRQDGLQGSIKLTKILAKSDCEVEVMLSDRKTKKANTNANRLVRGRVILKAVPPNNNNSNRHQLTNKHNKGQLQSNPINTHAQHQQNKQDILMPQQLKQQYVFFKINKYHPIQPHHNNNTHLFLEIYSQRTLIANTNTIWNHPPHQCNFQEQITAKIRGDQIMIWLCDRKQTVIKLGYGLVQMKSAVGVGVQVGIVDISGGKDRVIGYLCIDYIKNGLQSISKIPSLLSSGEGLPLKQNKQTRQVRQNIIDEIKQEQIDNKQPIKPNNNDNKIIQKKPQQNEQQPQQQNIINNEIKQITINKENNQHNKQLTLLDIYNQLFTYIYTHPSLIQIPTPTTITSFINHLQPHLSTTISTLSFNKVILHKLNPNTHTIDTPSLQQDYESFSTYYQSLIAQKDAYLSELLVILNQMDLDVNALEYQLRKNKSFWNELNELLRDRKGRSVNLIEHIRKFYDRNEFNQPTLSIQQFCDSLREYQVYQTTKGHQISTHLISSTIYHNLVQLLLQIQPYIEYFSHQELKDLLDEQQIMLSTWQLLNLQQYIASDWHQRHLNNKIKEINLKTIRTINKYNRPAFMQQKIQQLQEQSNNQQSYHFKDKSSKEDVQQFVRNNDSQKPTRKYEQDNKKPTMTKSPTFGYLHPQPEMMKGQLETSQKQKGMVQSLAMKMHNLPISPINYTTNKSIPNHPKVYFSNLIYPIQALYIDNIKIHLSHSHSPSHINTENNASAQQEHLNSKERSINKYSSGEMQSKELSNNGQQRSWITINDTKGDGLVGNVQRVLWNVFRQFQYSVQLTCGGIVVQLQVLSGQWSALVSEDGQYLGTILIN